MSCYINKYVLNLVGSLKGIFILILEKVGGSWEKIKAILHH